MLQFIQYFETNERPEKYFTVVYWDQRGSGMTFSSDTDPTTMTVEQMVEDTRVVTEYLKQRFGQEKIYLLGHSWGSYLGVKTIEKYPENYHACIGVGQVTNQTESERLAYKYMLNHAKEIQDREVIDKLEKFDPYAVDFPSLNYLIMGRTTILNKYRIGHLHMGLTFTDIPKTIFAFDGYTLREKINWFHGADFSMIYLFPAILKDDLFVSSVQFTIPFYVIQGAYDYMTSHALAEKYLNILEAPQKEFFTFDNSAHSPNMEEPEKFIQIVRKIALENSFMRQEAELYSKYKQY
ncbi:MAG: alpha/beta hydrolase [Planctomycetaceae bacterium]|jgi:pimeloyl-ACP methyl ester carboxylesterase|nr:alpha/beta hydrolase [Planctomycetaceae bacterium]